MFELGSTPKGGAAHKVLGKLLTEGLVEEVLARDSLPVWRRHEESRALALRVTPAEIFLPTVRRPRGGCRRDRRERLSPASADGQSEPAAGQIRFEGKSIGGLTPDTIVGRGIAQVSETTGRERTCHSAKMRRCTGQFSGLAPSSPCRSYLDCITNMYGYSLRKAQR